jgi:hypothetical protein
VLLSVEAYHGSALDLYGHVGSSGG